MTEIHQTHRTIAMARLPLDAEIRAKTIVEQLGGVWRGTRGECRCPAHDDGSPSLSVRLGDTAILFHCFAGCTATEVLKALQRRKLHDSGPLSMPEAKPKRDMGRSRSGSGSAQSAGRRHASPRIISSPAGCPAPSPRRCASTPRPSLAPARTKRTMPAMIAAVENDLGLVAVQRTFLDPDNVLHKPIPSPRSRSGCSAPPRSGSRPRPTSWASPKASRTHCRRWSGSAPRPGRWAASSAWPSSPSPRKVRRVIVYGDRGRAADRLLEKARDHLTANGRELVSRVPDHHDDWNDAWRAHLSRALQGS